MLKGRYVIQGHKSRALHTKATRGRPAAYKSVLSPSGWHAKYGGPIDQHDQQEVRGTGCQTQQKDATNSGKLGSGGWWIAGYLENPLGLGLGQLVSATPLAGRPQLGGLFLHNEINQHHRHQHARLTHSDCWLCASTVCCMLLAVCCHRNHHRSQDCMYPSHGLEPSST